MTTVKGVNYTKASDPATQGLTDPGDLRGRVRCFYDEYEAASIAANDLIQVGDVLPNNARILMVHLFNDALGSGVTLDVGDVDTVDRYIDGADGNTVSLKSLNEVDGMGYQVTGTDDNLIHIKNLGAAATGTIRIVIFFVTD